MGSIYQADIKIQYKTNKTKTLQAQTASLVNSYTNYVKNKLREFYKNLENRRGETIPQFIQSDH